MLRFGITTRITDAEGYSDPRDSLAHDWFKFFRREFKDDVWVPLPNMGAETIDYFKKLELNVLLLSGGDNLGETPIRDETEKFLLEYALENKIPVIGVCRGMQLINNYLGGNVKLGDQDFIHFHRATEHLVLFGEQVVKLNSFHNNVISADTLSKELAVLAACKEDGSVEAVRGEGILAVMWHPERPMEDLQYSTSILKNFIKEELWQEQ